MSRAHLMAMLAIDMLSISEGEDLVLSEPDLLACAPLN